MKCRLAYAVIVWGESVSGPSGQWLWSTQTERRKLHGDRQRSRTCRQSQVTRLQGLFFSTSVVFGLYRIYATCTKRTQCVCNYSSNLSLSEHVTTARSVVVFRPFWRPISPSLYLNSAMLAHWPSDAFDNSRLCYLLTFFPRFFRCCV